MVLYTYGLAQTAGENLSSFAFNMAEVGDTCDVLKKVTTSKWKKLRRKIDEDFILSKFEQNRRTGSREMIENVRCK